MLTTKKYFTHSPIHSFIQFFLSAHAFFLFNAFFYHPANPQLVAFGNQPEIPTPRTWLTKPVSDARAPKPIGPQACKQRQQQKERRGRDRWVEQQRRARGVWGYAWARGPQPQLKQRRRGQIKAHTRRSGNHACSPTYCLCSSPCRSCALDDGCGVAPCTSTSSFGQREERGGEGLPLRALQAARLRGGRRRSAGRTRCSSARPRRRRRARGRRGRCAAGRCR